MASRPNESGIVLEPQPNRPFSIGIQDAVWIVQSGKLDLFLVHSANGEPAGARYHFLRVGPGRALFPVARNPTVASATARFRKQPGPPVAAGRLDRGTRCRCGLRGTSTQIV